MLATWLHKRPVTAVDFIKKPYARRILFKRNQIHSPFIEHFYGQNDALAPRAAVCFTVTRSLTCIPFSMICDWHQCMTKPRGKDTAPLQPGFALSVAATRIFTFLTVWPQNLKPASRSLSSGVSPREALANEEVTRNFCPQTCGLFLRTAEFQA